MFDVFYTCLSRSLSVSRFVAVFAAIVCDICVRQCVCVVVVRRSCGCAARPSVAFELRSSTELRLCLCWRCCCYCCFRFGSGTGFGFGSGRGSWPRLQLHFGLDPSPNANVSINLIVNMCASRVLWPALHFLALTRMPSPTQHPSLILPLSALAVYRFESPGPEQLLLLSPLLPVIFVSVACRIRIELLCNSLTFRVNSTPTLHEFSDSD